MEGGGFQSGPPGNYPGPVGNTSGQGATAVVPNEIKRWNWGAFLLTFIWGLGNKVYISLLSLLVFIPFLGPFIGLGMTIFLGVKGSELAWQKKPWESIENFQQIQKKWAIAGFIVTGVWIFLGVMGLIVALVAD